MELLASHDTALIPVTSVVTLAGVLLSRLPAVPVEVMLRLVLTAAQMADIARMDSRVPAALLRREVQGFREQDF